MKISSKNDVPLIENALLKQGFPQNHITIITDAKGTREGISNAFINLANASHEGDMVFVHFSGHGQ